MLLSLCDDVINPLVTCLVVHYVLQPCKNNNAAKREVVTNPLLRCSLFFIHFWHFFFFLCSFYNQIFFIFFLIYLTVVNVQLPLIILGHSYRAFTKLLALGNTERRGWAVQDVHYGGVTEGKEQGAKDMGRLRLGFFFFWFCFSSFTKQIVRKRRFWVNIYLMLWVHDKQSELYVCLYI